MLATIVYSSNTSSLEIHINLVVLAYFNIKGRVLFESCPPIWIFLQFLKNLGIWMNVIAIIRSFYLFWEVSFEIALSRSCSTLFVVRFILCPVSSSDSAESTSTNHWVKISLSRSLVIFETSSRLSYIVRFDIFTLFLEVSRNARILALMNHTA